MRYVIILKVRKFHQSTRNRFHTAGKKPVGGGGGGHNRIKLEDFKQFSLFVLKIKSKHS